MPIDDYKCNICGAIQKDVFVHTRKKPILCICGNEMTQLIPTTVNLHIWPREGIYLEHVSADGETFHSKSDMKRYAKEHDLELGALL